MPTIAFCSLAGLLQRHLHSETCFTAKYLLVRMRGIPRYSACSDFGSLPNGNSDHEDDAFFMLPDMEEVDVGEPDEAKKDPFNSDKASKCLVLLPMSQTASASSLQQLNACTCTEARPFDSA